MSAWRPTFDGDYADVERDRRVAGGLALCFRDWAAELPWWRWRLRSRYLRAAAEIERLLARLGARS